MKSFLKIGGYIFHPLWMPFLGALSFFIISPRFFPPSIISAKLFAIAILTVFIPVIFYFLLKNLNYVSSIELKTTQERKLPLLFFVVIISMVINYILGNYNFSELFNFFRGILLSACIAFLSAFLKYKISLHMMGISGLFMFVVCLSITYGTNLTYMLAFLLFSMGWTASGRLQKKAHSNSELILGTLVGILPQALFFLLKGGVL